MSREANYQAIILKKQAYGEADEIITFFSREAGKVRALAKSVKLAKARLQNALQALFWVDLVLAGKGEHLPKIIFAEPRKTFSRLRHDLNSLKRAFYASELVLKFTPDGQRNEQLFDLLLDFLKYLEAEGTDLESALAKFKAGFLSAVGLSATAHQTLESHTDQLNLALALEACSFTDLNLKTWSNIAPLQKFLSDFIVYHLEREVKSEAFLKSVI